MDGRNDIFYGTNIYNEAFKEIMNNKEYSGLPDNITPDVDHRALKGS